MKTCHKQNYKINYQRCKLKWQGALKTKLHIEVNYLKTQWTWFGSVALWSEHILCT